MSEGVQLYRGTRIQITGVQGYRLQGYKDTDYRGTRIQIEVQGYR